jgi:hypothetical protein
MSVLKLSLDELVAVVRSCDAVEITDCTPPYFQEFVARRLDPIAPALAAKVRGLDAGQMDDLCGYIKETYRLITRSPGPSSRPRDGRQQKDGD